MGNACTHDSPGSFTDLQKQELSLIKIVDCPECNKVRDVLRRKEIEARDLEVTVRDKEVDIRDLKITVRELEKKLAEKVHDKPAERSGFANTAYGTVDDRTSELKISEANLQELQTLRQLTKSQAAEVKKLQESESALLKKNKEQAKLLSETRAEEEEMKHKLEEIAKDLDKVNAEKQQKASQQQAMYKEVDSEVLKKFIAMEQKDLMNIIKELIKMVTLATFDTSLPALSSIFSKSSKQLSFYNNISYQGESHNGIPHGYGRAIYGNEGEEYEGFWNHGLRNGRGLHKWDNGTIYEGAFFEDAPHGQGVYTMQDGNRHSGGWEQGARRGIGVFTSHTGAVSYSVWEGHKMNGPTVFVRSDKQSLETGAMKDDKWEGPTVKYTLKAER